VLTNRSEQLLDVSVAGLLLADPLGELRVVAASSEAARPLELFQLQDDQGRCLDCSRSGQPVSAADLTAESDRWPRFAASRCRQALPRCRLCRCGCEIRSSGALNLFGAGPGPLGTAAVGMGQALADVATISLLHERSMR